MIGARHVRLLTLASVVVVVAALYFAKVILVPIAIAFLLAFLLSPLVSRLRKVGLPRIVAVIAVMLLSLAFVCGLGWVVVNQINSIVKKLPEYQANLQAKVATFRGFQSQFNRAAKSVTDIASRGTETKAGGPGEVQEVNISNRAPFLDVLEPLGQIASVVATIGVVFLFVVLMLLQKQDIRDRLIRLSGSKLYLTTRAFDEAGAKVSRYILLTTLINGAHGVCIAVALSLLGIPNAVLWGVLAALLRFIPYIGPWVAAAFPVALALTVFSGWTVPLLTIGLILALELVSNNIVEPWVYGTGTGVSAGALLVAAIFWTWLWGVPGLFLATPLTVCLAVIGKHVPSLGFLAVLLGDEAVLPPEAKLYQRLLAMDQEEASEIVLAQLKDKTLVEVFDETLIPALVLAERDHHSGTLDDQTQMFVIQAMRELVEEAGDWRRDLTRSEKRAAKEGEDSPAHPQESRPRVQALCVAADDEADHVVALMAAQVLRQIGFVADVVEVATLTGQLGQIVEDKGAQVVLISDVPPSGFAHVRYICKRLAVKSPDMPIVVGVWGSTLNAQKARERLPEYTSLYFVKSLKETVARAQELIEGLRLESAASATQAESAGATGPGAGVPAPALSRLV
jgi:predicted PurR-regulated permease PerM